MPGVFTHGTFDTWTPGYLMFIAATHNGISRLYETFGNGGADTLERTLGPNDTARTWYRQNPPLPKAKWSQRNNNNYQQTGLLVSLNHFADNKQAVPQELLPEEQALDPEAEDRRAGGLRVPRRRSAARAAGRSAAHPPAAGLRDLAGDRAVHGHGAGRRRRHARSRPTARRPARRPDDDGQQHSRAGARQRARRRRRRPAPSRPAATSCAWISPTAASPTRCSTTSTGRPTIRSAARTTTPAGPSASCSTSRSSASPTSKVLDAAMELVKGEVTAPGGVTGTGSVFADQPQRRPVAGHAALPVEGRADRRRRGAVRGGGQKFNRGSFIIRERQRRRARRRRRPSWASRRSRCRRRRR